MKLAVLGCGSIGRRHLGNLQTLGQNQLLAFDPAPGLSARLTSEFGVTACSSPAEVWDWKPEAVLITTPSNLHLPLALEAARHNCHLFIEKPLAHSLDGIDALAQEVQQRQLIAMVACNMRFHPGPATVKRLLEQQAVGDVIAARIQTGSYLPRWRPQQDYRASYSASTQWGGALLDCIHEIDLALWYFGPARLASAVTLPARSLGLQTDGLSELLLQHDSNVLSSVHLNFVQRDYRRSCQIIGSAGSIYWDFADHRVQLFGPEGTLVQSIPEPAGWELNQMYLEELTHFLQAVESRAPTTNPLDGGRAALALALEARTK